MSKDTNTDSAQHRLSNLLHNNTSNIPEQDYIEMQNCLAEINHNLPNQNNSETTGYESRITVTMNEMGMGHFYFDNSLLPFNGDILPHQQPLWIVEWILKQTQKRSENGFGYADFNFDIGEEFPEINNCSRTDYDEIKTKVIPILQSKGLDITLYHENINFEEDNEWGNYYGGMTVSWDDNLDRYNMIAQREFFSKTRDSYYYLPVDSNENEN